MSPTPPPPSFIITSPYDNSSHPVIPSPSFSDDETLTAELISPSYFPPWISSASSSTAENPFSTNAASTTPPPRSRSVTPRPMDPDRREARFGNSSSSRERDSKEKSRLARGRALRVNTLHQRAFHPQEISPLPYPPEGFSTQQVPSANVLDKGGPPQSSPFLPSPSKTKAFRSTTNNRFYERIFWRILSLPDSPLLWLALYFTLNLTLTLYNKSVLIHFPFPYTLTALHAFCGTIGTFILIRLDPSTARSDASALTSVSSPHHSPTSNMNAKELLVLFLFSILYTLNIVVSNASLRLVTVPFHQVVRASTPFFTIMFSVILLGKRCTRQKLFSLIPVVAGVGFATYGDYYFTAVGFFLTLLGTLLAALKTILTNVILVKPSVSALPVSSEHTHPISVDTKTSPRSILSSMWNLIINHIVPPSPSASPTYQTKALPNSLPRPPFSIPKLSLGPIHLLYILSPLAFVQTILLAHFTGELKRVHSHLFNPATATSALGASGANGRIWLLLNGVLAFFLNVVSFNANRRVGPLGMSVAANVKQVLTVLCAVVIFDLTITPANGVGIVLTLIGGALYAAVELKEKEKKRSRSG
ncbi:hypothetical protein M413DRAFT_445423 [Hebeloma cylindrosporum]|uniref:Sugar phosphate transporter domain-containing protein n=1 Tax=Hebeloma cylindrosporum TaxID=76867 RepID=A0A0C2YK32_HEBCY|nr:hypothetical protein M413DRAFT_445423 [Hebeloma cylindrosporum h7]